ncbi:MAG: ribokinase [bacterium]
MKPIVILGVFVADLTFRSDRMPKTGETLIGSTFKLGPGGKGSNQVVAARRAGSAVSFITMLGKDPFAQMALDLYEAEGVDAQYVFQTDERDTGAADIMVNDVTGDNAIIVVPGSADLLSVADVDKAESGIAGASVFMTNLEVPVPVMQHGLELACKHQVPTIFNPAPAVPIPESIYSLCDYFTPNESEASALAETPVTHPEEARVAAQAFRRRGVKTAVITLGEMGCYVLNDEIDQHVPAFDMRGKGVETTGAGDAFNGGFAHALASGMPLLDAVRFGSATAAISVTRPGTAPAMPTAKEIQALFNS